VSADLLWRAGEAVREHALSATPGPWAYEAEGFMGCGQVFTWGKGVEGGNIAGPSGDLYPRSGYSPKGDMQFIALMHPLVALALAALLDEAAESLEEDGGVIQDSMTRSAVALARAILREES
jgi:hypothetical protein